MTFHEHPDAHWLCHLCGEPIIMATRDDGSRVWVRAENGERWCREPAGNRSPLWPHRRWHYPRHQDDLASPRPWWERPTVVAAGWSAVVGTVGGVLVGLWYR